MVLVDTSRWIDHLSASDPEMQSLLQQGEVLIHPFVIGELAVGNLNPRATLLRAFAELPQAVTAEHHEVMAFVERLRLFGRGIGYIDAALLASVRLMPGTTLLTRDRRLHQIALELGIAESPPGL